MLEAAETGARVDKETWRAEEPELRAALIQAQQALRQRDRNLIVVVAGDDRPSVNEVLNLLHEWLDPRGLESNVFDEPNNEEERRPAFWRYWRRLPAHGKIGVFADAWTWRLIDQRLDQRLDDVTFHRRLDRIRRFENLLADDGSIILKLWLHLDHDAMRKRFKKARKDPLRAWRAASADRRLIKHYRRARRVIETTLRRTGSDSTPWHLIDCGQERHRDRSVGRLLLAALQEADSDQAIDADGAAHANLPVQPGQGVLSRVDLARSLDKDDYKERLDTLQARLFVLSRRAYEAGIGAVLAFEGWDAAGKGGVIRRLSKPLDAARYRVIPIAAPSDEERAHHYLWRFWRHLPPDGRIAIFDRSWYGRVLVERVEGFARPDEWQRAYSEINDFEEQIVEHGHILLKFWLHIDPDEQLRRFKARESIPFKQYKITDEDYRNRERWEDYARAVNDLVARTSSEFAPWHLIAANDKRHARISVLERMCQSFEERLG